MEPCRLFSEVYKELPGPLAECFGRDQAKHFSVLLVMRLPLVHSGLAEDERQVNNFSYLTKVSHPMK